MPLTSRYRRLAGLFRDVFLVGMADASVKTVSKDISERRCEPHHRNAGTMLGADWDD